ncbi:hypothetical protein C7999DRAFT_17592 [Corynascus novoguineensis]|uniref:C2H2-type domain-containing protein n=1 Tax=Corynascus novoguineensis TaxID=1126955 RepID=A0AAN7HLA2_9PEZI|nr:hypothetical protein C7999DRAFT_17592 [Corynascus novoguineensis]
MDPYPKPSSAPAFDGFQHQDGNWYGSSGMFRSGSQSTNCTVDSSYTASTVISGYSSATEISSSVEWAPAEDVNYPETPLYPDPCSSYEPSDANHILSATGSQYLQSGHSWPQALQLSNPSLTLGKRAGNEEAARQATLVANSWIINGQRFGDCHSTLITSEAVDEAVRVQLDKGVDEPVRPAVQDILYQQLKPRFSDIDYYYTDIIRLLEEAAYHLQIRLQGPEVFEICSIAIAAVLAMLSADPEADNDGATSEWAADGYASPSAMAQASSEKEKFKCRYPNCPNWASRQADLDRHYKIMHLNDDQKEKYYCDYKKCPRHKTPFFRQDHFRDHLRIYHKEDLLRRGNKGDDEWWSSRAPYALCNGWWRCRRCLVRVRHDDHGFTCPGCGDVCEKERQQYRTTTAATTVAAAPGTRQPPRAEFGKSSVGFSSHWQTAPPAPALLGRKRLRPSSTPSS